MLVFQTCAVLGLAREGANGCPDNGKGKLAGRLVDSKGPGSDRTFLLNRLLAYRNTRSYRGLNRGRWRALPGRNPARPPEFSKRHT
jgi:hypothetical protein